MVNLETGDVLAATRRRDELAVQTTRMFADARIGKSVAPKGQDRIRRLGEMWAAELAERRADSEEWHRKVTGAYPEHDDHHGVQIVSIEDAIESDADELRRSHGKAAGDRLMNIAYGHLDVDHHLDAYLAEAGLAEKTTTERRALVRRFATWAASNALTMASVTRSVAGQYVTTHIVPMNRRTASKHLTAVSQYWDYLGRRGHASTENPWKGQLLPENRKRVDRGGRGNRERGFTVSEMTALLYPSEPAPARSRDGDLMADAMLIAALSGMREAEIITLWASDVKLAGDGSGVFDLQHGKNPNAAREVPIHPMLIATLERRMQGKSGRDWLFPELSSHRNPADAFGKRFATYRRRQGVDEAREGKRRSLVNFHSFRRWFVTEAERAGHPLSIVAAVVGHEEGRRSVTGDYSDGPSMEQRRACVEAVKLPTPASTNAADPQQVHLPSCNHEGGSTFVVRPPSPQ